MADIECVNPGIARGRFRSVLFDFDGTLSLIRQGWREIMVPMMVETLGECRTGETEARLSRVVSDFVDRLTGKQTIYQMIRLAEEVRARGGAPPDPVAYKHRYHERLNGHIRDRIQGLRSGVAEAKDLMVPGSLDLLRNLERRGLTLYLASGTDEVYVKEEADLLGLTPFFEDRVYGALDRYEDFSKERVIRDLIASQGIEGGELLGFGDGYVEIENVKSAGGMAVGVASDEARRRGVNAWKRERLIQAGADLIIPDFRCQETLVGYLLDA
ncbi:MAG: haloacid dehalogenase-like hydrolase [Gemmatimonadota bacterium]|nr:haloacid dehalogenase-like hydrolase [Gemmatimonadota bacterium]